VPPCAYLLHLPYSGSMRILGNVDRSMQRTPRPKIKYSNHHL